MHKYQNWTSEKIYQSENMTFVINLFHSFSYVRLLLLKKK